MTVSYGRGIPLGRTKGLGEKKERAKRVEKESRSAEKWGRKRRRNEGECCFDVKGDRRVVVEKARGQERKVKERGLNGREGGKDERKSGPQTVSSK